MIPEYSISEILLKNLPNHLSSVFILFRCLLDDFIHLIHLAHCQFEIEEIIKLNASAHKQRFKIRMESWKINQKYFNGEFNQLDTEENNATAKQTFMANPSNDQFFIDKEQFKFKTFPSMQALVDSLPDTELGKANVHAFLIWKFLSQYVHYSNLAFELENNNELRAMEINQLHEALSYCYKTILLCYGPLNLKYPELEFKDPKNVADHFNPDA